ncbi:MAG: hypothetical protein WBY53_05485 [Acidobacteriaceae bacterium]
MAAKRLLRWSSIAAVFLTATAVLPAQIPTLSPNLARTQGIDTASGIAYTRLYISAQSTQPPSPAPTLDLALPTLTAQCSKRLNGKSFVELFVNFGGVTDPTFYPPWKPAKSTDFPPVTAKVTLIMEFIGYTKVKPVRRQWERVSQPDGQLRYNPPGSGSTNLEPITFYLQFLRALPTFRVTGDGHTASFLTDSLLTQMRKEPLCSASGL